MKVFGLFYVLKFSPLLWMSCNEKYFWFWISWWCLWDAKTFFATSINCSLLLNAWAYQKLHSIKMNHLHSATIWRSKNKWKISKVYNFFLCLFCVLLIMRFTSEIWIYQQCNGAIKSCMISWKTGVAFSNNGFLFNFFWGDCSLCDASTV